MTWKKFAQIGKKLAWAGLLRIGAVIAGILLATIFLLWLAAYLLSQTTPGAP